MYEIEMNLDAMHKTLEYSFHFFFRALHPFLPHECYGLSQLSYGDSVIVDCAYLHSLMSCQA